MKPKTLLGAILAKLKEDAPFGLLGASLNLLFSSKFLTAFLYVLSTSFLFNRALLLWEHIPLLFESPWSRMICAMCVVTIGIGFYILRERKRFLYASLELSAGIATAYFATTKLYNNHETSTALFALLGSIYIVVRACDNYNKVYMTAAEAREKAPTLQ